MCGICGFVNKKDEALLGRMRQRLIHRGPDSGGAYIDDNASLGIRRLNIIDLETGDQPIYNEDKTLVLVYNGEIYNFQELRDELKKKGHSFYTNTDTEVIIHLYEEHKDGCVDFLRGMFAFALWDKREKRLFIARDRVGEKPLYYTLHNGVLLFASELKALLEDNSLPRDIDLEALDYYLRFLYIPAPLTIFKGIYKLFAGHSLVYQEGHVRVSRYWELDVEKKVRIKEPECLEKTRELIEESVKMRLVSDVPLGVFLSGGIDSSIIVAMMRKNSSRQIDTFSIGFEEEYASYNEFKYSRLVSRHFSTDHQEFIVRPQIAQLLPKIAWHLDEPFADSSAILTYLISHQARKYATVALSGIGGDELFCGYPRYLGARLSLYYHNLPYSLRNWLGSFGHEDGRGRLERFLKDAAFSEAGRYINWVSLFRQEAKQHLYNDWVKAQLRNKIRPIHKDHFSRPPSAGYLDRIFYLDVNTYLTDDLLFMGDRMSMANYLELRVPFCDHKLMEFCASLPYNLKMKGYRLKYLLKKSFRRILPHAVLSKPKQGFMVPIGEWFKGELKDFVNNTLSEERIRKRGYFNPDYIKQILNSHFKNKVDYTHHIWALLMLELWFEAFYDGR